jgi:hypothetical protein
MNTGVLGRPGPGDTRFFYPIGAAELLGSVSAALGVVLVTRPAASAWSLAVGVGAAHCLSVKLTHCHTL